MMRLGETLGLASVEGFLDEEARAVVLEEMTRYIATLPSEGTTRTRSVHTVPGLTLEQTLAAYEPAGRFELDRVPPQVHAILGSAAERALPALRRVYPSARRAGDWIYLEYGPGQYITPHIDCVEDPADRQRLQVAGISVTLNDDYSGGEFVAATASADRLFRVDDPERVVDGADSASAWFRGTERTEWVCRPPAGTALCYGAQLIHSTRPVTSGVVKKIIGFLIL